MRMREVGTLKIEMFGGGPCYLVHDGLREDGSYRALIMGEGSCEGERCIVYVGGKERGSKWAERTIGEGCKTLALRDPFTQSEYGIRMKSMSRNTVSSSLYF